jgi:hypothetical protein
VKRLALLTIVAGCHAAGHAPDGGATGTWSIVGGVATGKLTSIHGSGPSDIWIAGDVALHGDGVSWTTLPVVGNAVFAFSATDAWLGTGCCKTVDHWDGGAWSTVAINDNRAVQTLWGTAPNDLWGTEPSPGYLGHFDGAAWTHVINLFGVGLWSTSSGDVWLADDVGVVRWTGPSGPAIPISHELTASGLAAISGTASDDVWSVGVAIHHRDAAGWSSATSPTTATLRGVAAIARDDAWAVGDAGTIVHFDGTAWRAAPSPTSHDLYAIWAASAGDAWAVGDAGTILHLQ